MRTEITEIETKKIIQTINKSKNSFLKKINQNVDPTNQNKERPQILRIRNDQGNILKDNKHSEHCWRMCLKSCTPVSQKT